MASTHDLDSPIPRHANGLDGQQVLPVVRHDVSRAGFQGAGDDRVVVAIASDEIDGICPFHDLGVGQGPDEALDLRIGQLAKGADRRFAQRLLDFGQQVR